MIQARVDRGLEAGPSTEELAEIKALRREVADQQRTIEMLKADGGHLVATRHPQRGVQPVAEEDLAKGESIGVMAPW